MFIFKHKYILIRPDVALRRTDRISWDSVLYLINNIFNYVGYLC